MANSYSFIIDSANNFGNPKGWEDLSIQYKFDGVTIREDFNLSVEYCESSHPGSWNYFNNLSSDPCSEVSVEIRHFSNGILVGIIAQALIRVSELSFDCYKKSVTVPLENVTALKRMEEGQSETVCTAPGSCLELFQYESGGTYLGALNLPERWCGETIPNILNEFASFFGGSFVSSPIINGGPYRPEITNVLIPAIVINDTIILQITSSLGSTFEVEVTANGVDTASTIAEKLANGLICQDFTPNGYEMSLEEIVHRISCTSTNADTLIITTDWEVEIINLYINGIPQPGAITTPQAFNYSLENLHLFSDGLTGDEVCITWQEMKSLLNGLFNAIISDTQSGVSIDTYENTFSAAPSTYLQDKIKTKKFDSGLLNRRARFGSAFEYKNLTETIENWAWIGNIGVSDNITVITFGTPVVLTQTGIGKLAGQICLENTGGTTANFTYEILLNGTAVASQAITLLPGELNCFDIDDFFFATNPEDNRFCLAAGVDSFTVNPTAPGLPAGVGVNIASDLRVEYNTPCVDIFQGRGDNEVSPAYTPFEDLSTCISTLNKTISSGIYTGLGLAISQQIEELNEYDDIKFAILGNPSTGAAYQFERCLFFPSTDPDIPADCSCIGGQVISHYYYNVILQKPHIFKFFQQSIPSDMEIPAFEFRTVVNISGNYSYNMTEVVLSQPKVQDNLENYSFDHCLHPASFNTLRTERKALHQDCNALQIQGVIKEMEMFLEVRRTKFIIEG